jgi:hypothetical protein
MVTGMVLASIITLESSGSLAQEDARRDLLKVQKANNHYELSREGRQRSRARRHFPLLASYLKEQLKEVD